MTVTNTAMRRPTRFNALAGLIETIINPSEKVVPIRRKGKQA